MKVFQHGRLVAKIVVKIIVELCAFTAKLKCNVTYDTSTIIYRRSWNVSRVSGLIRSGVLVHIVRLSDVRLMPYKYFNVTKSILELHPHDFSTHWPGLSLFNDSFFNARIPIDTLEKKLKIYYGKSRAIGKPRNSCITFRIENWT